jgi:hypothetical protein
VDGQAFGSSYPFGLAIKNSSSGLKVGEGLKGGVDEIRISDVARYSGMTYIVPSSPLACDAHTRALWHFDEVERATTFHDLLSVEEPTPIRVPIAQATGYRLPMPPPGPALARS